MLHQLKLDTTSSCQLRDLGRLHASICRTRPQHKQNASLTVGSTPAVVTELDSILSSCDHKQRETLQHLSDSAYQTFTGCSANQNLSQERLVSVLLRVAALRYLWQQQYSHDTQKLSDINRMVERVAALTEVMAGGSSEETLQAIERHPPLISQHPNTVAERMVNIKQLIPQADVPQLVSKRPSILCMETPLLRSKVQKAAQQLRALMPAIPWEGRLKQDNNLFMTFVTLLDETNMHSAWSSRRG